MEFEVCEDMLVIVVGVDQSHVVAVRTLSDRTVQHSHPFSFVSDIDTHRILGILVFMHDAEWSDPVIMSTLHSAAESDDSNASNYSGCDSRGQKSYHESRNVNRVSFLPGIVIHPPFLRHSSPTPQP
ncbi:hypothetical protein Hypma_004504 [Hypsizygus marmoreus]|uniref:Uncharacterized protein n=1 Tax=Hypsizygus marmoreus TaxID=39966 RepID=A0A369K1L0_HYPMA|nr:hypothetical protein Hypma_004504 [Hypsizygus marmoreus]